MKYLANAGWDKSQQKQKFLFEISIVEFAGKNKVLISGENGDKNVKYTIFCVYVTKENFALQKMHKK